LGVARKAQTRLVECGSGEAALRWAGLAVGLNYQGSASLVGGSKRELMRGENPKAQQNSSDHG
jgi:hypothetical protein